MTADIQATTSWWGSFNFQGEQSKEWNIGPLKFIVQRLKNEWQVAYERTSDFDNKDITWSIKDTDQAAASLGDNSRFIFQEAGGELSITPRLADRPIISRPLTAFNLTAGEEVTLYVSSSVWIELAIGSAAKTILKEIAIQRPSDTWFGPSTLEGELCYASTTHCRLSLDELPHLTHRAITPVRICNRADTTLSLERLNLPAPLLSLYADLNGQLWTPQVSLIRQKDGDIAELKIENKLPEDVQPVVQLSEPRTKADSGVLFRAFNTVFS